MSNSADRCRLCLMSSKKNLVSITSNSSLSNLVQNLLRLTLFPEHDLICAKCCTKMETFNEFMKVCHASQKVLVDEKELKVEKSATRTRKRREQPVEKSPKKAKNDKKRTTTANNNNNDPVPEAPPSASSEPKITASSQTFQCTECHENFWSKVALDVHMRQHYHNTNERCAHCFAIFKTPYELKVHTRIHVNNIVGGMKAAFQEMMDKQVNL
ncbi:zinc finger protein 219-like [Culicoides brevitarsis]|uniref:zinc finger protein 219-like n=1 Tax=Culicoides brevitarsis TaxID=469753 RepID=UPI00307B5F73